MRDIRIAMMQRITRHMTTAEDLADVLRSIVSAVVDHTGASVAHILLNVRDEVCPVCRSKGQQTHTVGVDNGDLHFVASAGLPFEPYGVRHRISHTLDTPGTRLIRSNTPVVVRDVLQNQDWVSGDPSVTSLLRAMGARSVVCLPLFFRGERLGALGYITRQEVDDEVLSLLGIFADQAATCIKSASLFLEWTAHRERLQEENRYLQDQIRLDHAFTEIVGASPGMHTVLQKLRQVAPVETTVLLTGETGTGKELVARALHEASPRKDRTLVKVNCGALPTGVVESELFGHEKGAFTGALQQRIGRFELAHRGTLFMDEVGELPLETQVKLLRVLQEREFERVGSTEPMRVDVRIVAATNRDLEAEVGAGRFRSDLLYRLNVFPIRIPPLRERPDDIPLLVAHILRQLQQKLAKPLHGVTSETMVRLQRYPWPGNIRELQNVLERAAVLANGPTVALHEPLRPPPSIGGTSTVPPFLTMDDSERAHIRRALDVAHGRVHGARGAATLLGINASTLRSRMQKLGIEARAR